MKKFQFWALIIGSLYVIVGVLVCVLLGHNKIVVIAEDAEVGSMADGSTQEGLSPAEDEQPGVPLSLQGIAFSDRAVAPGEEAGVLSIPVGSSITPENISVENRFSQHVLMITLHEGDKAIFQKRNVTGEAHVPIELRVQESGSDMQLFLHSDGIYAYETTLQDDELQVVLKRPQKNSEKIIVLDEQLGMDKLSEDALSLQAQIGEQIKLALEKDGIKVYTLLPEQEQLSGAQKGNLVRDCCADFYLGLMLGNLEDETFFGSQMIVNTDYYMPGITNGKLGDLLEKEMVSSIEGRALGLLLTRDYPEKTADDGAYQVLMESSVPSAIILPGYYSNEKERKLMEQPSYMEKIAEGIAAGIESAYAQIEE